MSEDNEDIPSTVVLKAPLVSGSMPSGKEAMTTTGKLLCLSPKLIDPDQGSEFWLTHGEETLGSANECSVRIRSTELSAVHARIVAFSDQWLIETGVDSTGVWINDALVESRSKLSTGDIVRLGGLSFRFDVLDVAPSEIAVVPEAPKVAESPKVRLAQTLQLELSPDGELVDVSKGQGASKAAAKKAPMPGNAAQHKTSEQQRRKAKVMAQASLTGVPADSGDDEGLESALDGLYEELPDIIRMLVAQAREGNVDAACACLIFASREGNRRPPKGAQTGAREPQTQSK